MAAHVYLAEASDPSRPSATAESVMLDSDGVYWFLYRYFEAANLDRATELIDLYGGGTIEGYQLHRLRTELEQAYQDVQAKAQSWRVMLGWTSERRSVETEDWQMVQKVDVLRTIEQLLALIRGAQSSDLKLVCSGD
jgi:hypothetical protein